jgi:NAD(P)-dependent dehydrogenase (short-subunit alcohol dehydrogenase family)
MKAVVIGTGAVGHAVTRALTKYGHQVVTVGRNSGDHRADITDINSLATLFASPPEFDAVACAAGDVFPPRCNSVPTSSGLNRLRRKVGARSTLCAPRCRTSPTTVPSRLSQGFWGTRSRPPAP